MSQATWDLVKGIFKKKRKAEDEPSDEERWFRVWDALFPEAQRPPTAYYEESHMHSAYQARALEVFDCLLTNEPQLAPVRSHRDYIIAALRRALDVAGQGTQLDQEVDDQFMISPPPPHAPLPSRNAQDRALDTNQRNISEPGIPDATNPYAGLSSHLEQPRYPDRELIDDVALYGLSDPTYTDMNFIANECDDTLYLDPREFGSL
ncbi:hypothetical protein Daesc_004647 [Daldinia eschscholtzii]|uniref:Uncharacterized protein n=1 Tax=Daldinia eschscholtzii TaxID=292717 RepID=A0AAX6MPY1_9PEZI